MNAVLAAVCLLAAEPELQPILAVPDRAVFESDFAKPAKLNKEQWQPRQGTRWTIVDGVLRGESSSAEFQAAKKDHKGLEPRIAAPMTPKEFVIRLSVRFVGGTETNAAPFVEFGHHVARLQFSKTGVKLIADHESVELASAPAPKFVSGEWLHLLAELRGEELVVQFKGGPTLYGKHKCFAEAAPAGANGLGVAGARGGLAELDNLTIHAIKPEAQAGWDAARAKLPAPTAKPVEKAAKKKAKKAA